MAKNPKYDFSTGIVTSSEASIFALTYEYAYNNDRVRMGLESLWKIKCHRDKALFGIIFPENRVGAQAETLPKQ